MLSEGEAELVLNLSFKLIENINLKNSYLKPEETKLCFIGQVKFTYLVPSLLLLPAKTESRIE